jgi:hypothetical protein
VLLDGRRGRARETFGGGAVGGGGGKYGWRFGADDDAARDVEDPPAPGPSHETCEGVTGDSRLFCDDDAGV